MKWQKLLHHCSGFLNVGEGFLKENKNQLTLWKMQHLNVITVIFEKERLPSKLTNDRCQAACDRQTGGKHLPLGGKKLWEPVAALSAAFTEAVHNEANTFQVCTLTGGRSAWGAKAAAARVQSSSRPDSWRLEPFVPVGPTWERPGRDFC